MPKVDISKSPCVNCITFPTCARKVIYEGITDAHICNDRRAFLIKIIDRINGKRERKKKHPIDNWVIHNSLVRLENKYMEQLYGKGD